MIYCFIVDNGLGSSRTISSDQITLLDVYKTSIEIFVRIKQREVPQSHRYLLFVTSNLHIKHQLTIEQDQLGTFVERVKMIQPSGWSDWDTTFGQLDEYLALFRLSTMQDTIGQGIFMSMVQNTQIFVLSDRIPTLLGTKRTIQPQPYSQFTTEIDESWLSDLERSDTNIHLTFFDSPHNQASSSTLVTELKKKLGIVNTKTLVHSYVDAASLGEQIACLEEGGEKFLNLSFHSFLDSQVIRVCLRAFQGNSGYWCFPETQTFISSICAKKSKLTPKSCFISPFLKEGTSDVEKKIPTKFPIDQFYVIPESMEQLIQFLHLPPPFLTESNNNEPIKYFDIYASIGEDEEPFGYLKITQTSCIVVLLPWNFYSLFNILNEEPKDSADFMLHLFYFLNGKIPKSYINPLKSALKQFGISTSKFPYPLDEGYIPECISNRNNLANICKKILQKIHQEIQTVHLTFPLSNRIDLPTKENVHLMINFENVNEKFLQLTKLFLTTSSYGYDLVKREEQRALIPISKMSDFYRNLDESLKFRNPYEDESSRHEKVLSLFSNPFKRKRKLPIGDEGDVDRDEERDGEDKKIKRLPPGSDKSEDEEFASIVINVESNTTTTNESQPPPPPPILDSIDLAKPNILAKDSGSEPSPELKGELELKEDSSQFHFLRMVIRNPGDSIEKVQSFLSTSNFYLTIEAKERLLIEAAKFKKYRLIEFLNST